MTEKFKKLELIVGSLSDLRIEDDEENFVSAGGAELTAEGTAIGLAAAGLAGAATSSLIAVSGGADNIQIFTGLLDDKRISGRFSKIWFASGDQLECVVDRQKDGSYAVYAVRRPSDQTLWMFPHCSRGSKKHWQYAAKMCILLSVLLTALLLVALMFHYGFALWSNEKAYLASTVFIVQGVTMGFYFSLKTAFKWRPFVAIAESIFQALGYPDPARVDLGQQDRIFRKNHPPDHTPNRFAPWIYRYPK